MSNDAAGEAEGVPTPVTRVEGIPKKLWVAFFVEECGTRIMVQLMYNDKKSRLEGRVGSPASGTVSRLGHLYLDKAGRRLWKSMPFTFFGKTESERIRVYAGSELEIHIPIQWA